MKSSSVKCVRTTSQCGFSLIELMVALSVMMLLAAIAIPSFNSFVQSSSVDGVQVKFQNALLYARSEAIKRNAMVKICRKQAAANQCELPATNDWSNGWLIYIDTQDDSDVIISGSNSEIDDKILKIADNLSPQASFTRTVTGANPLRSTICFNGLGMICSELDQQSTFVIDSITDSGGRNARRVLVSIVGKISLESDKY